MSFWKKRAGFRSRHQATVRVFAPAKVNLTLHVTGQRRDGYHTLDSLVMFAPMSDVLTIRANKTLTLEVDGPERMDVPDNFDNLVVKVAQMLGPDRGASLVLTKNIPVASGIGGGSADAAAAFRGLLQFWKMGDLAGMPDEDLRPYAQKLLELGADIPLCLTSVPARVTGIGETVEPLSGLPDLPVLLVNPRRPVSTAEVFRELRPRINAAMPEEIPGFVGPEDFAIWLAQQRNDLQATAIKLQPTIADVLDCLEKSDRVMLARMSGSGATCYGVFPDKASAIVAGELIRRDHPDWWVSAGILGNQQARAMPVVS